MYFETAQGSATVFNRTIDLLIEGAERRSGAASGPVKKAAVISVATIATVLNTRAGRAFLQALCVTRARVLSFPRRVPRSRVL